MKATFCVFPIECNSTIEIGSSAGGGIARQTSMCGIAAFRAQSDRPSGTPRPIPSSTAIEKPSPIRSRLGTTCLSKSAKSHSFRNSTAIVVGRGNFTECAFAAQSCQPATIAIGTPISAPSRASR